MSGRLTIPCPVCGAENLFEDEDRGGQIECASHGGPIDIPLKEAKLAKPASLSSSTVTVSASSFLVRADSAHENRTAATPLAAPRVTAGRELWQVSVNPRSAGPLPLRNCPMTDGQGRLVAALQDVVVCLVEAAAGVRVVWEYSTGGFVPGSPGVAPDGSLRVHSSDGRLHGLSPEGQPLWPPVQVREPPGWSSPLVDQEGTTWLCAQAGGVIRVDAAGQTTPRPYFRSPTKFNCTGVLLGGMLVVGGEDQFVHAINLQGARGAETWDQRANCGRTGWFINSAIALASGPIFVVASRDQHLYGFAPDGSELWKTKIPGQVLGSPVVDGADRVFVGLSRSESGSTPQGAVACFDIAHRQWLWEVSAEEPVESTPVVGSDGIVYFGDNAGWVRAVNAAGQPLWQVCTGRPVRSAGTIVSSGHVVFGDDAGRLFAIQCDSSSLAGGWPKFLGPAVWSAPTAIFDEASRHSLDPTRAVVRVLFDCSEEPSATSDTKPTRTETPPVTLPPSPTIPRPQPPIPPPPPPARVPVAAPIRVAAVPPEPVAIPLPEPVSVPPTPPTLSPTVAPPSVAEVAPLQSTAPQPAPGRLVSVVDYRTGADLLPMRPYPWPLVRTGQLEQRALFLNNDGSGNLFVTVSCAGRGVTVSPTGRLRIPPGRQKFVVLGIEPAADEWLLVEFQTPDSRPGKRCIVRIQRTGSPPPT